MTKRLENVTSPDGTSTRVTRLPKRSRYERIGRGGSEAILSGVSRSASREGWMLSWRIIGVAAGHSKATSKPASISMAAPRVGVASITNVVQAPAGKVGPSSPTRWGGRIPPLPNMARQIKKSVASQRPGLRFMKRSIVHAAHAAASRHCWGGILLRRLGHHGLGGDHEAGDRRRVLKGDPHDLGRIDDAGAQHVDILLRLCVKAVGL